MADAAKDYLLENFHQHGDCLQTGFLGTSLLMPTLTDNGMDPNGMNSFNHYAYGAVCQWIWQTCAGIASDPAQPGFKHNEGDEWTWDFTIPVGTTATVTLPGQTESREYTSGTYTIKQK